MTHPRSSSATEIALRLLQASSCFRPGAACGSLPCACAQSLVDALSAQAGGVAQPSSGTERALLGKMVYEAVRFALWGAGQGLCPAPGEAAASPEDFLLEYCKAADVDDWDGLPLISQWAITHVFRSAFDTPTDQEPFGDLVGAAQPPLNAIQFIALLEILGECAEHVPAELKARISNVLNYHSDHDTVSALSSTDRNLAEGSRCKDCPAPRCAVCPVTSTHRSGEA